MIMLGILVLWVCYFTDCFRAMGGYRSIRSRRVVYDRLGERN